MPPNLPLNEQSDQEDHSSPQNNFPETNSSDASDEGSPRDVENNTNTNTNTTTKTNTNTNTNTNNIAPLNEDNNEGTPSSVLDVTPKSNDEKKSKSWFRSLFSSKKKPTSAATSEGIEIPQIIEDVALDGNDQFEVSDGEDEVDKRIHNMNKNEKDLDLADIHDPVVNNKDGNVDINNNKNDNSNTDDSPKEKKSAPPPGGRRASLLLKKKGEALAEPTVELSKEEKANKAKKAKRANRAKRLASIHNIPALEEEEEKEPVKTIADIEAERLAEEERLEAIEEEKRRENEEVSES